MRPGRLLLAALLALWLLPAAAAAQERAELVPGEALLEIRLADGSTLYARVVAATAESVVLVTEAGARVEVDRARIVSAREVEGVVREGEAWPPDRSAHRLFGGPTGRTLAAGAAEVGVVELFFPYVTAGLHDRFQVSVGTTVLPEAMAEVFWVAPKVGLVATPNAAVAAGFIAFFATGDLDEGSIGAAHVTGTFGGDVGAITVGAGWPFLLGGEESEWVEEPVVTAAAEWRATRRVKLVTENLFILGGGGASSYALFSGGLRIVGDRLSADAGLGAIAGEEQGCCLPIVNFAYSFGGDDR